MYILYSINYSQHKEKYFSILSLVVHSKTLIFFTFCFYPFLLLESADRYMLKRIALFSLKVGRTWVQSLRIVLRLASAGTRIACDMCCSPHFKYTLKNKDWQTAPNILSWHLSGPPLQDLCLPFASQAGKFPSFQLLGLGTLCEIAS